MEEFLNLNEKLPYDFYGKKIWMLMNIELWYRNFIDN
jgi:asparagine synthase (glutamine-hydrolysing)